MIIKYVIFLIYIYSVLANDKYHTEQQRILMQRLKHAFIKKAPRFADMNSDVAASRALVNNRNKLMHRAKYQARTIAKTSKGAPVEMYWDSSNQPGWMTPPWVANSFRLGPLAYPMPSEGNFEAGPMFLALSPQPLVPFESQQPADNQPISGYFHNYPDLAAPDARILSYGTTPSIRAETVMPSPGYVDPNGH